MNSLGGRGGVSGDLHMTGILRRDPSFRILTSTVEGRIRGKTRRDDGTSRDLHWSRESDDDDVRVSQGSSRPVLHPGPSRPSRHWSVPRADVKRVQDRDRDQTTVTTPPTQPTGASTPQVKVLIEVVDPTPRRRSGTTENRKEEVGSTPTSSLRGK